MAIHHGSTLVSVHGKVFALMYVLTPIAMSTIGRQTGYIHFFYPHMAIFCCFCCWECYWWIGIQGEAIEPTNTWMSCVCDFVVKGLKGVMNYNIKKISTRSRDRKMFVERRIRKKRKKRDGVMEMKKQETRSKETKRDRENRRREC